MRRELTSRDLRMHAARLVADASVDFGSRVPTKFPEWVTLEVGTGGFASGKALSALAEGEVSSLTIVRDKDEMTRLLTHLRENRYIVERPEDTALPIVLALLMAQKKEQATAILSHIGSYMSTLRLYPKLTAKVNPLHTIDVSERFTFSELVPTAAAQGKAGPKRIHGTTLRRRLGVIKRNLIKWHMHDLCCALEAAIESVPVEGNDAASEPSESATYLRAVRTAVGSHSDAVKAFFAHLGATLPSIPISRALTEEKSPHMRVVLQAATVLDVAVKKDLLKAAQGRPRKKAHAAAGRAAGDGDLTNAQVRKLITLVQHAALDRTGGGGSDGRRKYSPAVRAKEMAEVYKMLGYECLSNAPHSENIEAKEVQKILTAAQARGAPWVSVAEIDEHVVPLLRRTLEELQGLPLGQLTARANRSIVGAPAVRKVLHEIPLTLDEHVRLAKTIRSAETLALVLGKQARQDQSARVARGLPRDFVRLYSEANEAFSRRRSLLLLNYERQTRLTDLPWISELLRAFPEAAVDPRVASMEDRLIAQEKLAPVVVAYFTHFGGSQIPNKLISALQEPYKLVMTEEPAADEEEEAAEGNGRRGKPLGHDVKVVPSRQADPSPPPCGLTPELAQDIFMGDFTPIFYHNATEASTALKGSVYDRFFGLEDIRSELMDKTCNKGATRFNSPGKIIEAMQVLTTQNVWQLFKACEDTVLVPLRTYAELDEQARRFHKACAAKVSQDGRVANPNEEEGGDGAATFAADGDGVECDEVRILVARAGYRSAVEQAAAEIETMCTKAPSQYYRALARRRLANAVRQMLLFLSLRYLSYETSFAAAHMTSELRADIEALEKCVPPPAPASKQPSPEADRPLKVCGDLLKQLRSVVLRGKATHDGFFGWV